MADRVGEQFGNYRLIQLLGQGGFAEVYLGEHIHLGSQVAIKVLHTKFITREQDDFLLEARTIAALDHPSIVRVFDCGIECGEPFLIMSYAPHGTLRQRHPKGNQVPLPDVVSYVQQIASALQYAHDRKVIHRDIKPANILLGRNEEALLSDFGIALISSSSSSQSTKAAAGTVSYMAPEQIMGKPRTASDQYALGVVVYEWLGGSLPFHGSFPEMCAQHLYAPPPSLREKNPTIPPVVEDVVMKALAKEPAQRYSSVQEFAIALQQSSQQTISLFSPPSVPSIAQDEATIVKPRTDISVVLNTGDDVSTFVKSSFDTSDAHDTRGDPSTMRILADEASTFVKSSLDASTAEPIAAPPLALPSTTRRRSKRGLIATAGLLVLALLLASPFLYTMVSASLLKSTIFGTNQLLPIVSGHTPPQISRTPTLQSTQHSVSLTPTAQSTRHSAPLTPTAQSTQQSAPLTPPTMQPTQQATAQPTQQATRQPTQPSVGPPVQRQLSAQQTQAQTVNATGAGTTAATQATSTLGFYNATTIVMTYTAGTVFTNDSRSGNSMQVVLDATVNVLGGSPSSPSITAPAHAVVAGASGNVATDAFFNDTDHGGWGFLNVTPFTGGQDAQQYTYVQQSDIDGAASPLKTSTTQQATNGLQSQLKSNEHLVGSPQCSSAISSDHAVNDSAATVTVTVTTTCTGTAST